MTEHVHENDAARLRDVARRERDLRERLRQIDWCLADVPAGLRQKLGIRYELQTFKFASTLEEAEQIVKQLERDDERLEQLFADGQDAKTTA